MGQEHVLKTGKRHPVIHISVDMIDRSTAQVLLPSLIELAVTSGAIGTDEKTGAQLYHVQFAKTLDSPGVPNGSQWLSATQLQMAVENAEGIGL